MAHVTDAVVTPTDIQCGDSMKIDVSASFEGTSAERRISIRIPAGAQCAFRTANGRELKLTKPAPGKNVTVTFHPRIECDRAGTTVFLLFAQASEPGEETHEVQRTVSVTC